MVKGGAVAGRAVLTGLMFLLIPARVFADCWSTSFSGYNPIWTTPEDALDYATQHLAGLYAGQMVCVYKTNPDDQFGTWEPLIGIKIVSESVIAWSSPDTGWASLTNEGAGIPVGYEAVIAGYSAHPEALCRIQWSVDAGNISYYWEPGVSGYDASPEYIQKCRSQSYVIKITRADGSTQDGPAPGYLGKIEPNDRQSQLSGKNRIRLVANVYDENNQPVANAGIQIYLKAQPGSGGHDHDAGGSSSDPMRPDGSLNDTPILDGESQQIPLMGRTGSAGDGFQFMYTSPDSAGDFRIVASCTDGKSCTQKGPNTVWVGIKDLMAIPSSGFWELRGSKPDHQQNDYLSVDAYGELTDLAHLFMQVYFPFSKPMQLNDASLVRGGRFDCCTTYKDAHGIEHNRAVEGWWTPPHYEHRRGVVIDVDVNTADGAVAIPSTSYGDFKDLIRKLSMNTYWEGDHFHVRLMGVSQ